MLDVFACRVWLRHVQCELFADVDLVQTPVWAVVCLSVICVT